MTIMPICFNGCKVYNKSIYKQGISEMDFERRIVKNGNDIAVVRHRV